MVKRRIEQPEERQRPNAWFTGRSLKLTRHHTVGMVAVVAAFLFFVSLCSFSLPQPHFDSKGGTAWDQGAPPQKRETKKSKGGPASTSAKPASKPSTTQQYGFLEVRSIPPGAKVTIDGRTEEGWVTPCAIRLPAGPHLMVASKEGYEDVQRWVTIEAGRTASVNVQSSVPGGEIGGEINITTRPPGIEVFIDGRSYGPSPVRATLAPGQHTYVLSRSGMELYRSSFTMENGAILMKAVSLGGEVIPAGIVVVRTIPAGATVYADGSQVGSQTPTSFRLSAGHHRITISLSGFRPVQREIELSANGSAKVNIHLSRQ